MIEYLQDLIDEMKASEFADTMTWTPRNGSPVTITGIFDRSARDQGIAGRLWMHVADLPAAGKKMDVITIDGVNYELRSEVTDNHDGAGGVSLFLRKMQP